MAAIETYIAGLPDPESAYARQYHNWCMNRRYHKPVSSLDVIVQLEIETNIQRIMEGR